MTRTLAGMHRSLGASDSEGGRGATPVSLGLRVAGAFAGESSFKFHLAPGSTSRHSRAGRSPGLGGAGTLLAAGYRTQMKHWQALMPIMRSGGGTHKGDL